jgi:shikimate kinase
MHVKLKGSPGIYVVGFMGSGKTTVGRLLAKALGWDFIDLDAEIEKHAGARISDIFEQHGEPAFRAKEHEALIQQIARIREGCPRVVSLGGGAFAAARNREAVESAGVSIWLQCPAEELWERVAGDDERPLARNRADFMALYEQRQAGYEKADYTICDSGEGPEKVVKEILRLGLV